MTKIPSTQLEIVADLNLKDKKITNSDGVQLTSVGTTNTYIASQALDASGDFIITWNSPGTERKILERATGLIPAARLPQPLSQIGALAAAPTAGFLYYNGSAFSWATTSVPDAAEGTKGIAFLATSVEALAGVNTSKVITPATLQAKLDDIATDNPFLLQLKQFQRDVVFSSPQTRVGVNYPVGDNLPTDATGLLTTTDYELPADYFTVGKKVTMTAKVYARHLNTGTTATGGRRRYSDIKFRVGGVTYTLVFLRAPSFSSVDIRISGTFEITITAYCTVAGASGFLAGYGAITSANAGPAPDTNYTYLDTYEKFANCIGSGATPPTTLGVTTTIYSAASFDTTVAQPVSVEIEGQEAGSGGAEVFLLDLTIT